MYEWAGRPALVFAKRVVGVEYRLRTVPEDEDTPVPLASRGDVRLGPALIRPSMRTVEGPDGKVVVEPRVMQVLLALVDANGAVISREDFLRKCWGGRIVGDDAINRAVAEARRVAQTTGAGYRIETIARVGYRLERDDDESVSPKFGPDQEARASRRKVLAGAAAAMLVTGGGGLAYSSLRNRWRVQDLIDQAKALQARGVDNPHSRAAELYRQAISLDPDRAESWGRLSLALTALANDAGSTDFGQAQRAAEKALALDPNEPSARTSMAVIKRGLDDWVTFESELLAALRADPANLPALNYMTTFLQGVGRCEESRKFNELALGIEPLAPDFLFKRAFKFWIFGRPAEADRVSARALELWPGHAGVWNARVTILAFTGRPEAAQKMVEDDKSHVQIGAPAAAMWRTGLQALATHSPADVDRLREIAFRSALLAPGIGANAVMLLSSLRELDAAFQVAEGFLMRRGRMASASDTAAAPGMYADTGWRGTQWLFTPATRAFRADPRFTRFCEGLGYLDYWRARRVWPDSFVRGSLVIT